MKVPNVVLVGHVCIDQNTTENASYTSWGSSVLYIDQFLRTRHHVQPLILAEYGPDLLKYTPDVHFISKPTQSKSLVYENDTRSVPRIWRCHNTEFAGEPELTPEAIAALKQADIVIIATLLPNYSPAYIKELMSYVRPEALTMLCSQGYLRDVNPDGLVIPREFIEAPDIMPLFDIVIYSEEDTPKALEYAGEWAKICDGHIIVTQGDKGASIVAKDGINYVPTSPIPVDQIVDSVGCGSVFDAAVAYGYFETENIEIAVEEAHQVAARKLLATAAD